MIYTERKYLTIMELQKERTSFSYEELFQILMDRPSAVIYVELRGALYGIITRGRIQRAHQNHLDRVGINKNFTSIGPNEAMNARRIFESKGRFGFVTEKIIHVLPVTDSNGMLLGNYTIWDDLLLIEHSLPLLKNMDVAEFAKRNFRLLAVKPCANSPAERRLFAGLMETLKEKGLLIETIEFRQILDHLNSADYILFCDAGVRNAANAICMCVTGCTAERDFLISYQDFINILQDRTNQILIDFQNQGVEVLAVDFEETESGYWGKIEIEIDNSRRQNGRIHSGRLCPEMRKEFLLGLYESFEGQELPVPVSFHMQDSAIQLRDTSGPLLNVKEGCRYTTGQPETYERCIYMYGTCPMLGLYVDDQHTIPSLLQERINLSGLKCKVANYASARTTNMERANTGVLTRILSTPFRQGDIIVFDKDTLKLKGVQTLNLTEALEECQAPVTWFVDYARHCNHRANEAVAESIYKSILPAIHRPVENRQPISLNNDPVKQLYIDQYFKDFDASAYNTVGSIVMNCNPFTFGHRYLIEEALKQVEFLIIFVVQQDLSLFTFEERLAMVYAGTADLSKVMVVPSGVFILSRMTFPEYFIKESGEELLENTENDVTLFAGKIAPALGITHRFVGEEPEDKVTDTYNQAMKRILPAHGIRLVELPRKQNGTEVISASRVRRCLEENDLKTLDTLVPDSTKKILFCKNE